MGRVVWDEDKEKERQFRMTRVEAELSQSGYRRIAGVDEAGRGPLAGPVVAAALILPANLYIPGLNDSKQVSPSIRARIYDQLMESKAVFAVGIGSPEEIDQLNILGATRLAMTRAVEGLSAEPDFLLIDALVLPRLAIPQRGIIHGDALSLSIAAASIIAKVTRDRIMDELDRAYPGYGLAKHKGYPTPAHYQALDKLGPTPVHRRSFRLTAVPQLALEIEGGEAG